MPKDENRRMEEEASPMRRSVPPLYCAGWSQNPA